MHNADLSWTLLLPTGESRERYAFGRLILTLHIRQEIELSIFDDISERIVNPSSVEVSTERTFKGYTHFCKNYEETSTKTHSNP